MSLQLMCGRIGAVVGTNLVGYFFKTSCDSTFLVFGAEVLCKYSNQIRNNMAKVHIYV